MLSLCSVGGHLRFIGLQFFVSSFSCAIDYRRPAAAAAAATAVAKIGYVSLQLKKEVCAKKTQPVVAV